MDISISNLHSADAPVDADGCQDPPIPPRIGDEYQVALPPIIEACGNSQLPQEMVHSNGAIHADCRFGIGLAIPVYWIPTELQGNANEKKGFSCSRDGVPKAETNCSRMKELNPKCGPLAKIRCKDDVLGDDMERKCKNPLLQQVELRMFTSFPDTKSTFWSNAEKDSFLLGLYIFGKNLLLIKRFMETKGMGDILSYYYGTFYRSDAYRKWSECRKTKSRKYIQGQRIFTGWRQHEILSRLLSDLSEENLSALMEASQRFTEGILLLEEYVSRLKQLVGMKAIVEAVAIGKGKRDLTGIALDPARASTVPSFRPDIPVGKACSSLSSTEIISFLTGGFRISKARSNDLFWEAVWPRLLARGWHSEQPKNQRYPTSRQALVFLVPGVKKFSRRKLIKGDHYYDSVADVLNKVASDPKLLELEVEGSIDVGEGNLCISDMKVNQYGVSDHKFNSGPRADLPISTPGLMKFTIVDTSMGQGEAPYKITDLRSLPLDGSYKYSSSAQNHDASSSDDTEGSSDSSSDKQHDSFERSLDNLESVRSSLDCETSERKSDIIHEKVKVQSTHPKKRKDPKQVSGNRRHNLLDELPVKYLYMESCRKSKPRKPVYLSPVSKRRRLTACKHTAVADNICSLPRAQKLEEAGYGPLHASDTSSLEPGQILCKTSMSLGKDSLNGSSDNTLSFRHFDICTANDSVPSGDKCQHRMLIDLNIPPDTDANETFEDASDNQNGVNINGNISSDVSQPLDDTLALEQSTCSDFDQGITSSRRQSTRNRPPTTRVLESLESGFLSCRRRASNSKLPPSVANRPSRRERKIGEASLSLHSGYEDNVSSEGVGTRAEDGEDDNITGCSADPLFFRRPPLVLDHNGIMYNFLDGPQNNSPDNLTKDHTG